MTGQDIIDAFENIIDDSPEGGDQQSLFLLNTAKDLVEAGRDWNFNRAVDSTQSRASGDNYLTFKTLPSDYLAARKLFVAGDIVPWNLIPYEDRDRYKDVYKRWYIDLVNSKYALCGASGQSGVISLFYGRQTPAITTSSSPVWPSAFHPLLPFKMAEIWGSTSDADDINYRMSKEQLRQANDILKMMIQWDARMKTAEYNAKNIGFNNLASYPNVVGEQFIY